MRGPDYRKLHKRERKKLGRLKKDFRKEDSKYMKLAQLKEDINTVYYLMNEDKRFLPRKKELTSRYHRAQKKTWIRANRVAIYVVILRKRREGSRIPIPPRVQETRNESYLATYRKTHKAKRAEMKERLRPEKEEAVPRARYKEVKSIYTYAQAFKGFVVGAFTCVMLSDYDGWFRGDVKTHYVSAHIENGYITFGEFSRPLKENRINKTIIVRNLIELHRLAWPNHEVGNVRLHKIIVARGT